MRIQSIDSSEEPITFEPDEYFCAFKDTKTKIIVGFGNIVWNLEKGQSIYISNLETVQKGDARKILEYLLESSPTSKIEGKYTNDSKSFWLHVGAKLSGINRFKLTLKDYKLNLINKHCKKQH